jgi:hypothetical protein
MERSETVWGNYKLLKQAYCSKNMPARDIESIGITITDARFASDYLTAMILTAAILKKINDSELELAALKLYNALLIETVKKKEFSAISSTDQRYLSLSRVTKRISELEGALNPQAHAGQQENK